MALPQILSVHFHAPCEHKQVLQSTCLVVPSLHSKTNNNSLKYLSEGLDPLLLIETAKIWLVISFC